MKGAITPILCALFALAAAPGCGGETEPED